MKPRLIFLVLLIVCFSCGTNNKPVSDAQKEKIKGDLKEIVDTMFKGCEEANFEMATGLFLDSPDFVFIFNGVTMNYKGVADGIKPLFSSLINQKVTITDEKYAFLDNSTVIYTTNCKFLENYKDGHAILSDPMVIQVTFKNINGKWKAINGVESSVRQNAKNTEVSKEIDQVELMKQFIGNWKKENSKDTIVYAECKAFNGGALEFDHKTLTKGKLHFEEKWYLGYDKANDKYIAAIISNHSPDIQFEPWWFTSKNICEVIPYNAEKGIFEFKTPDLVVLSLFKNNKMVSSSTYSRIKQ